MRRGQEEGGGMVGGEGSGCCGRTGGREKVRVEEVVLRGGGNAEETLVMFDKKLYSETTFGYIDTMKCYETTVSI